MDAASTVKTVARANEFLGTSVTRVAVEENPESASSPESVAGANVDTVTVTNVPEVAVPEEVQDEPSPEQQARTLEKALSKTTVQFSVSVGDGPAAGEIHFQVVDKETGEVIRSFPPEKFTDMLERVKSGKGLAGVLVNKSA